VLDDRDEESRGEACGVEELPLELEVVTLLVLVLAASPRVDASDRGTARLASTYKQEVREPNQDDN
jgi:hypothetical protein